MINKPTHIQFLYIAWNRFRQVIMICRGVDRRVADGLKPHVKKSDMSLVFLFLTIVINTASKLSLQYIVFPVCTHTVSSRVLSDVSLQCNAFIGQDE